jgi:hypothetical protein
MARGNPNPSPDTRFGAENGNPNNLGGKTKEQRESEYKSAEMSAQIREAALSVMLEKVKSGDFDLEELITPANLKLFKDSEDRAHGTPKQSVDHTNSDGSMNKPTKVELVAPKTDDDSAD